MRPSWGVLLMAVAFADEITHRYKPNEIVKVWADLTGPWFSPRETYAYEELPLCELWNLPQSQRKSLSIGSALEGRRSQLSPRILIHFPQDVSNETTPEGIIFETPQSTPQEICRMRPSTEAVHMLNELIINKYYYTYEIDDLPVYGFLGEMDDQRQPRFFAHRRIVLEKNKDQIVSVSIVPSEPVALQVDRELRLTYETLWIESRSPFNRRLARYYESTFFERQVQYFSLATSTMVVLCFTAITALITYRAVKSDFAAQSGDVLDETEVFDRYDEAGWAMVAKEVFRKPTRLRLHAIFCGSGAQIALATTLACLWAVMRSQLGYPALTMSSALTFYALAQPANGFVGSILYKISGGKNWKSTAIWQLLFFPIVACALFLQINTTFLAYGSTMALSIGKMISVLFFFVFVHAPLHFVGVLYGRSMSARFKPPVKPNTLERPIPVKAAYVKPGLMLVTGAICFASLFVEVYFIMDTLWTHRTFFVFGFLVAVLAIYSMTVICTCITATYLLLNSEDYKWQWFSFNCGASPALYILVYAIYYKSRVLSRYHNFYQTITFWITTLLGVIAVGLASGTIGHVAAQFFVRRIYMSVKSD